MYFNNNFAKYLSDNQILSKENLNESLNRSKINERRLDKELIMVGLFDEVIAQKHLAAFLSLPYIDFNVLTIDIKMIELVPISYIKENKVFPISIANDHVLVAVENPDAFQEALNMIIFYNKEIRIGLITSSAMDKAITFIDNKLKKTEVLSDFSKEKHTIENEVQDIRVLDAPIVQLVDSILKEAVSSLASDIHIEPFEDVVRLRFRIDGMLIENNPISSSVFQFVLARFKILANMNIAERRIPQDGKIRMDINGIDYDFRVSTIPTVFGEKIVIRIYDNSTKQLGMAYLGIAEEQKQLLEKIISNPHGIVLVTGPTGSGKSTTLYTFLKELNKESVNITTVEDPVENIIEGVNQIQVNPKANLNFSTALRSILRQDPNIIMIGEIRDEETAQMAIRAAITGHLVLATLHTNDSVGTIDRLVDMGVPDYLVMDAMIGSIAQRLVRKLCPFCKIEHVITTREKTILGIDENANIYEAKGCQQCNYTGYRGRTAIFEILEFDERTRELFSNNKHSTETLKNELSKKGMNFLKENCLKLVISGITSIEEYETTT